MIPFRSRFAALALAPTLAFTTPLAAPPAHAETANAGPAVVASIPPIHSLVAGVMDGVGTPHLIVRGGQSPHSYSLRPSDAQALEAAAVVVWVGPALETFLTDAIDTLSDKGRRVRLDTTEGLTRLSFRAGPRFAPHDHDHDHDHDQDHDHEADHAHEHDQAGGHEADHAHEHDHAPGAMDPHLWLDPVNAQAMVGSIAEALAAADPAHAATYHDNAVALRQRLDTLIAETRETLDPVRDRPFVVFHDAYQYFEARFDLTGVGSISFKPEASPGAARLATIQETIRDYGAACVFAEPQFTPGLVRVVTEGTGARSGTLDPLGADLTPGPDLYFALIRDLATSLRDCLDEG